jgi:hypothetical protein
MRRRDALPDPETDHGLRELDAALAGEPTADPELTLLIADVDALRPQADASFLASLDARVHAGFPRERETPRHAKPPWHARLRRWELLAPVVAVLMVAALVTVGLRSTKHESLSNDLGSASSSSSGSAAKPSDSASASSAAGTAEATPPHPETVAKSSGSASSSTSATSTPSVPLPSVSSLRTNRKVERAASLTLTPAPADVQDTADGVVRAT